MTILPLDQLGFGWRSFVSAWWWLWLLYGRPRSFYGAYRVIGWLNSVRVAIVLFLCGLGPLLFAIFLIRIALIAVLPYSSGESTSSLLMYLWSTYLDISDGMTEATMIGPTIGIALLIGMGALVSIAREELNVKGRTLWEKIKGFPAMFIVVVFITLVFGIIAAIANGITFGITNSIIYGITYGIIFGFISGILFEIAVTMMDNAPRVDYGARRGYGIFAVVAVFGSVWFAVGFLASLVGGIASGIAYSVAVTRLYYYPLCCTFIWPIVRGRWYPWHPLAWDDMVDFPLPGVDRLLFSYSGLEPEFARNELDRLLKGNSSQIQVGRKAQVLFLVREAAGIQDLNRLAGILNGLPEGETRHSIQIRRVKEMAEEISRSQIQLDTVDRAIFREGKAELLCERIVNFRLTVGGMTEPLATELSKAADAWLLIAQKQLREIKAIIEHAPTPQVFRAGEPVDRAREAFVSRLNVFGELEQQIMLSTGCPGLILYGRRRTGKSTILKNLRAFLPDTVVVIDDLTMEDAKVNASLTQWIGTLAERMTKHWPASDKPTTIPATLPEFRDFLDRCNLAFGKAGKRLLIALDEYQALDAKMPEVFPPDLLPFLRTSIQEHRHLTWVFAGSREVHELTRGEWTSYLVSARTIEVGLFTMEESRLLLTDPLKYAPDWQNSERRPRFTAFWGERGVERVHAEAGAWPHLVQLVAETAVDVVNQHGLAQMTAELFEETLDKAIVRGDTVLRQLLYNECQNDAERAYVEGFRTQDEQPTPETAVHQALRRRLLITDADGQCRLRVPLMLRWLRARG